MEDFQDYLQKWLDSKPEITEKTTKSLILALLVGKNFRQVFTEPLVKKRLFIYYSWIMRLIFTAKKEWNEDWIDKLIDYLIRESKSNDILQDMLYWTLGIGKKTAQNLELKVSNKNDIFEFVERIKQTCQETLEFDYNSIKPLSFSLNDDNASLDFNEMETLWILQIVGANTLTTRGSVKAKYGKLIEKLFLKVALTILGFEENKNFWLGISSDGLVDREVDGEVQTKRGRIRIDIGLIGEGNTEVSADKLSRVEKNGIVIIDKVGSKSKFWNLAKEFRVKLIQIRHTYPLNELYSYLIDKVDFELIEPPTDVKHLKKRIAKLPTDFFLI